jgi:hypothetical protein
MRSKRGQRVFSEAYKQEIVLEAEACTKKGQQKALLEREGLKGAHLYLWRKAMGRAPVPKDRTKLDERDYRILELERSVSELRRRAERAEALVELQKRVAKLQGIKLPDDLRARRRDPG